VKTLDKDLIAIEEDFKSRFSLFNCKIWIWKKTYYLRIFLNLQYC
jgi:hypothetical protein